MRKISEMTNKITMKGKMLLLQKHEGLNGVVVTIGLCVIAILLCVVLNSSLETYVKDVVGAMKTKTTTILGS